MSNLDESIDIRWIPLAKEAFIALGTQIALVQQHIERIEARRNRYAMDSLPYAEANLELIHWLILYQTLRAVQNGKTVQPS